MTDQPGEVIEAKRQFVVAIAASAGGVKALLELLSALPSSFSACVVIVQHLSPRHQSRLAEVLSLRTTLKVKQAETGDYVIPGIVYVAPPDRHVLIDTIGKITLSEAAPVHFVRPSADVLFESVAASFQEHAIAVVLTGTGFDGATGVTKVKAQGGIVIVQDQATSEYFSMPDAAIHTGIVDFILPLDEIAPHLINLVAGT